MTTPNMIILIGVFFWGGALQVVFKVCEHYIYVFSPWGVLNLIRHF
jgi:hypothetical protein